MTRLNTEYRGIPRTTDVLSFALQEAEGPVPCAEGGAPLLFGDVVISTEQADRQREHRSLEAEVERLMVHGFCHLMGFDHQTDEQHAAMKQAEEGLLDALPTARR